MQQNEEQMPGANYGGVPMTGGGGGFKTYIVPVALSVVVIFGLAFTGFLPGTAPNYGANTQAMNEKIDRNTDDISAMNKVVADASAKASQASADIGTVKKDISSLQGNINGFATQSNLNALKQEVDTLRANPSSGVTKAQFDTLQAKVDTLTTQLADANKKIADLQNGTNGSGTPTTGTVTTSIVTNSNIMTSFTTTNSTTPVSYSIPFKIKVENGLNKEIQNIQIYTQVLGYATSGSFPVGTATMSSSTGGIWSLYGTSGTSWYFTNSNTMSWAGSGLTVPANTTKTITLIFTFKVDPNQEPATLHFNPDIAPISSGDYDIP